MKKKNETDVLNETIISLENQRAEGLKSLKEQLHVVHESLKPMNLIKSTFHEFTSSPEGKSNLVDNAIGITTGYLSRKALFHSANPVKKVIGTLLQLAVTSFVSKHSGTIKSQGENLLHNILSRRKKYRKEYQSNGHGV